MLKKLLIAGAILIFVSSCTKESTKTTQPVDSSHTPPVDTLPSATYEVDSSKNIVYGQNTTFAGTNQKLLLDAYFPKSSTAGQKFPIVVMAHGGSFLVGNKNNMSGLCRDLASKGYVSVSIDYRLGWDYGAAQSPAACKGDTNSLQLAIYRSVQDYNAAVRYLVHNATDLHIDTSLIFVGGSSAGAVAALSTTYITNDVVEVYLKEEKKALGGLKNASNQFTDAFTIKADVSMWGALLIPNIITSSSAVPLLAFHGSTDQTIPIDVGFYSGCESYPVIYGSKYLSTEILRYGVPTVIHTAQNQGHDPDMYQDDLFLTDNIHCFLQSVIKKTVKTASYNNLESGCP